MMKDFRIHFDGGEDTVFDFRTPVEGKDMYIQKMLINIATEKGSDPLYPDRGTNLVSDAVGGLVVNGQAAAHSGNFAALSTNLFVNREDYAATAGSPDRIKSCRLSPAGIDSENGSVSYKAVFAFNDGTSTTETISV